MAQQPYNQNRGGGYQGGGGYQQREQQPEFNLNEEKNNIERWVKDGIDKATISFAEEFGRYVANNDLTTSQIRTVFGEMRRIQMNNYTSEKTDFILLKPKLAYAVKRHNKKGLTKFFDFFSLGYEAVDTTNDENGKKHFENLMNLMEAVLAYHKYHGGKE